jgi:hypothetical protein
MASTPAFDRLASIRIEAAERHGTATQYRAVACGRGGPTNAAADRPPNDDAEDRQPRRGAMIRARSVRPWN